MDEESAPGFDRVDQLAEPLSCEARIAEMSLGPAGETVLRESLEKLCKFIPIGEKDVVVHPVVFGLSVLNSGSRLRTGDEEAVFPCGQIHVPHLSVIEDRGKIHPEGFHFCRPFGQRARSVTRTAARGMVVKFAVINFPAFIEFFEGISHDDLPQSWFSPLYSLQGIHVKRTPSALCVRIHRTGHFPADSRISSCVLPRDMV